MLGLMLEAKDAEVEFLCFPELALTEYFCTVVRDSVDEYFETEMPSQLTKPLFEAAKEAEMGFVLPYAEKDGERRFNSSRHVGKDGRVIGTYRKVHIPGTVEPRLDGTDILEKRYFTPATWAFRWWTLARRKSACRYATTAASRRASGRWASTGPR